MRNIEEYMNMPYTYMVQQMEDESGKYYYSKVLELDGCQSTGETFEEAYNNLREAMQGWIETKLDGKLDIPVPLGVQGDYSGKFIVRIPKSLHYKLAIEAKKEGVSLNQYALYKLSN